MMSPLSLCDSEVLNLRSAIANELTRLELLEFTSVHHKICVTCREELLEQNEIAKSLYFKITEYTSHPEKEMEEP